VVNLNTGLHWQVPSEQFSIAARNDMRLYAARRKFLTGSHVNLVALTEGRAGHVKTNSVSCLQSSASDLQSGLPT